MRKTGVFGIKRFLLGVALCAILLIGCAALASLAAFLSDDPTAAAGLYSLISLLLAGALSGFILSRSSEDARIFRAMAASSAATLLMLIAAIIISGNIPSLSAFLNYACYLGSAFLFSFIGKRRPKRMGKMRRRRSR